VPREPSRHTLAYHLVSHDRAGHFVTTTECVSSLPDNSRPFPIISEPCIAACHPRTADRICDTYLVRGRPFCLVLRSEGAASTFMALVQARDTALVARPCVLQVETCPVGYRGEHLYHPTTGPLEKTMASERRRTGEGGRDTSVGWCTADSSNKRRLSARDDRMQRLSHYRAR
jgi:hypothetical protein